MPFGRKTPIDLLTNEEVRAMIDANSLVSSTGIRNRAIIAALYRMGLRASELCDLKIGDYRPAEKLVHVINGKGGKSRVLSCDPSCIDIIQHWTDCRRDKLGLNGGGHLFCCIRRPHVGGRMDRISLHKTIKASARRAGITKRVHPHAMRHTMAHELEREGNPISVISHILGHANCSITADYLNSFSPAEAQDAMASRQW
jgi:integrase/recombinase XerD